MSIVTKNSNTHARAALPRWRETGGLPSIFAATYANDAAAIYLQFTCNLFATYLQLTR
jgi:hypothetical protein